MAKPIEKNKGKSPLLNNSFAPEIFADEAAGFLLSNNTLRITLASIKSDYTSDPAVNKRVVVGRLIIPLAAAEEFQKELTRFLEHIKLRAQAKEIGSNMLQ